jgi:hypothetical protein
MFDLFITEDGEDAKLAEHVRSSLAIAEEEDPHGHADRGDEYDQRELDRIGPVEELP